MNPDTHQFEAVTEETPKEWDRFEIGEVITIKNTKFVIQSIGKGRLNLRPWTDSDGVAESFSQRLERKMRDAKR
jgi:hypothetical protein